MLRASTQNLSPQVSADKVKLIKQRVCQVVRQPALKMQGQYDCEVEGIVGLEMIRVTTSARVHFKTVVGCGCTMETTRSQLCRCGRDERLRAICRRFLPSRKVQHSSDISKLLYTLEEPHILEVFKILLDADVTCETLQTARTLSSDRQIIWLINWVNIGDFWPDELFDAAYGC